MRNEKPKSVVEKLRSKPHCWPRSYVRSSLNGNGRSEIEEEEEASEAVSYE